MLIVLGEPRVQVGLEVGQRGRDLLAKCNPVELSEHRLMPPFYYPIRLRTLDLGAGMIDVFYS